MFHAEITIWCEKVQPGCTFVARLYDRPRNCFHSGQGDTALEAIAWCLDDFIARAWFGMDHRMARNPTEQPGDRFLTAEALARRPAPKQTPVIASARVDERSDAKTETGCFDKQITHAAAPKLHGDKPSAATRRAAARRTTKK